MASPPDVPAAPVEPSAPVLAPPVDAPVEPSAAVVVPLAPEVSTTPDVVAPSLAAPLDPTESMPPEAESSPPEADVDPPPQADKHKTATTPPTTVRTFPP